MAATITIEEVKAEVKTSASDIIIQGLIDTANTADACLDAQNLTESQEKAAKLYFVAYNLDLQSSSNVTSETSATGASRSYNRGNGTNSSGYGEALKAMAGGQCLLGVMGSDLSAFFDVVEVSYV